MARAPLLPNTNTSLTHNDPTENDERGKGSDQEGSRKGRDETKAWVKRSDDSPPSIIWMAGPPFPMDICPRGVLRRPPIDIFAVRRPFWRGEKADRVSLSYSRSENECLRVDEPGLCGSRRRRTRSCGSGNGRSPVPAPTSGHRVSMAQLVAPTHRKKEFYLRS